MLEQYHGSTRAVLECCNSEPPITQQQVGMPRCTSTGRGVHTERLMHKIRKAGVNDEFVALLESYLAERCASVIISGKSSSKMSLNNMIFQGTIMGP